MRITSSKLSILALVIAAALAMVPAASATTCPAGDTCLLINQSNLGSGSFGLVEMKQDGSNVDVSFVMNTGFAVKVSGGDIFVNTTGGLTLTSSSFSNFSAGNPFKLKTNTKNGGFKFGFDEQIKSNTTFVTTFSFTIKNANVSQLTGFGFHICVLNTKSDGCVQTGFTDAATKGTPAVPEPGTLGLLGTGLVGLAGLVRRRLKS